MVNAPKRRHPDHDSRIVRLSDDARHRALACLYERRSAVDNLIRALERYQQEESRLTAKSAAVTAAERSS